MGNIVGLDSVDFVTPSASIDYVQPPLPSWAQSASRSKPKPEPEPELELEPELEAETAKNTHSTNPDSQTVETTDPLEKVPRGAVQLFEDAEPLSMGRTVTLNPFGKYVALPDSANARSARLSHEKQPSSNTQESDMTDVENELKMDVAPKVEDKKQTLTDDTKGATGNNDAAQAEANKTHPSAQPETVTH